MSMQMVGGHVGGIEATAKLMREAAEHHHLEPTAEMVAAKQVIDAARTAVEEAQKVLDGWIAKLGTAKQEADSAENAAGKAAFTGEDLGTLGATIAAKLATVKVVSDALDLAAQEHEQRCIDYERARCTLLRLQIEQKQQRAEADTQLVNEFIDKLDARPGGVHCGVKISPVNLVWDLLPQLHSGEQGIRERQAKLDRVRAGAK